MQTALQCSEDDRGAVTYPLSDSVIVERGIRVTMRDGVRLAATVFRPHEQGRFPVVMSVTVYGKDIGPDNYATLPAIKASGNAVGTISISDATTWEGPDPGFWVPNGYVVIVANARGFYDSEGDAGIYSEKDPEDYADLIDWAGIQPWSNGSIGLNGVSYLAVNQWMCASTTKPSHLKAIVPWEGASDLLRDVIRPGGIPETRFLPGYYSGSLARGAGIIMVTKGAAMMERAARHPFPLENIEVPALVCASWSDPGLHTRGSIEGFARISSSQKWLYTHGRNKWEVYYGAEAIEWQKSFFDHFLKGVDNGFETRPRVRLESRWNYKDFEVRGESSWPAAGTIFKRRFLDPERGVLSREAPHEQRSCVYDAQSAQMVGFNLTFDRRTEVTGPMVLTLWVSALDADDLDLFVAVRKIDHEGREVHFCGKDGYRKGVVALGWLRVSQRHKDAGRSKPWRPYLSHDRSEKLKPGEVVAVETEILPSSTLFQAGEMMRLVVSGHDILKFARFGHDETVNRGRYEIHSGGSSPSNLLIPFC